MYLKENAILVGSISIDLCRERFSNVYIDKKNLSIKYNLDHDKKWIIFISSFVFASMTDFWRSFHYNNPFWGKEKNDNRMTIDTTSRDIILDWIIEYIK